VADTVEDPVADTVEDPVEAMVEDPVEAMVEDPVEAMVEDPVADMVEDPVADMVEETIGHEKCSMQNAEIVEMIVKYHSNQEKTDLFIAMNVSEITDKIT